ncbi:acyl-CoA dehydrogenase C-terminal domain-containing protein [Oleiagrimonas sp.]|jgi:alkylation response protein AidB-like acyl-CoA dehydrogenase|uniref:acyl-CoA dehydrogenase C-terminal domain-containing protein n=1 Tax=Oleiagrimonas sp. TaxID=2010330 RepID=UPI002625FB84|nr:acyl-CoA dehydrogenase C-terminal domain-containing protein [Oleiagrimonas sp.]MDA3912670.1 acyl-CoA dehydrogenase C-terminal domain-containing protein [Oleiagrimonas sp.]
MTRYVAPIQDMRFALYDLLGADATMAGLRGGEVINRELIDAVLEEAGRFNEQVLAPLNQSGDAEGCHFDAETATVTSPKGFKQAYAQYVEGGWPGLNAPEAYGGQNLPHTIGVLVKEMIDSANLAWGTYPLLSNGASDALLTHAEEWQREVFLKPLVEGRWTGTMCLTEPQAGSDLGLLKTHAVAGKTEGTWCISGTKIFITAGEHDLAENIVHLVLARLPDAPAGSRGISMFIVPKFKVGRDGAMGERNAVACGSIEHKMGLKGSATCVMNFDGAEGYLIGQPHKGLAAMFTMMNAARLAVGIQGLSLIERALQNSLAYCRERLQMRALSGAVAPDKAADPIIVHPDVRRMLLTQRAFAEGGRALVLYAALQSDIHERSTDDAERARAGEVLGFLIPICKGLLTEISVECTYHAMQTYGGHGYIAEYGIEQFARDARITTIYEGTTQIQALDLLGRKVMQLQGAGLKHLLGDIAAFCQAHAGDEALGEFVGPLAVHAKTWSDLTQDLGKRAQSNPEEIGAAAVDYLFYSGYIVLAWIWARTAAVAGKSALPEAGRTAKLDTARFYFARILPRTHAHLAAMKSGIEGLPEVH